MIPGFHGSGMWYMNNFVFSCSINVNTLGIQGERIFTTCFTTRFFTTCFYVCF